MKYYETEDGYIAVDPYKKVYKHGKLNETLVCGRGPTDGLSWYTTDQIYRTCELGPEVEIDEYWKGRLEEPLVMGDDYTARFIARVLVVCSVGFVIGLILQWFGAI